MSATCPLCGARYGGRREHCPGGAYGGCCRTFNSTKAGDKHRVGDYTTPTTPSTRRCLTPDEMTKRGMFERDGVWYASRKDAAARARTENLPAEQDPAIVPATPRKRPREIPA